MYSTRPRVKLNCFLHLYKISAVVLGLTKGVGFIRFNLKSEAEAAIKLRSGTVPPGATEPITVKFANQPTISKVAAPVQPPVATLATAATAASTNFKYVDELAYVNS